MLGVVMPRKVTSSRAVQGPPEARKRELVDPGSPFCLAPALSRARRARPRRGGEPAGGRDEDGPSRGPGENLGPALLDTKEVI